MISFAIKNKYKTFSEPFCISDEENLLLVSRYLIENNEADHVILDLELTNDIYVVLTIFKKLVGNYTLLEYQKEIKIYSEISQVTYGAWISLNDFSVEKNTDNNEVQEFPKRHIKNVYVKTQRCQARLRR